MGRRGTKGISVPCMQQISYVSLVRRWLYRQNKVALAAFTKHLTYGEGSAELCLVEQVAIGSLTPASTGLVVALGKPEVGEFL